MSEEGLSEFVLGYCDGKIFTSADVEEELILPMVFMPIGLGGFAEMSEENVKDIGCLWQYISDAGPRSINGYPIFMSCYIMNKNDWERATKAISREMNRREELKKTVLEGL